MASRHDVRGARFGFALPMGYDRSKPLVIDPGIDWSTFLGEQVLAMSVDDAGPVYVTGTTTSDPFPTSPAAYSSTYGGGNYCGGGQDPCFDAFVTTLSSGGTAVIYSTYLGGKGDDWGQAITVDGAGRAYVAGYTNSPDFPTTPGSYDTTADGAVRAILRKGSGAVRQVSAYTAGDPRQAARAIADGTTA